MGKGTWAGLGLPVAPKPARRPADKAREVGIPGGFRPKRSDGRCEAERFRRGEFAG